MQKLLMAAVVVGAAVVGANMSYAAALPRMNQATGAPDSLCVTNSMQGKMQKITIRGDRIARSGSGGSGLIVLQGQTSCYAKAQYVTGYNIMVGAHPVPYNFSINVHEQAPYVTIGFPGYRNASVVTSPECIAQSAVHQAKCTVTFSNLPKAKK